MKFQPSLIPRFNNDYNFNDLIYGIRSLFIEKNNDLSILLRIFGNRNYFFTNNGRSSLYIILKLLDLPIGSKVGVPLYSCPVVFDAITKAGCIPCFIDVDINNYTMDPKDLKDKIDELGAIVVIHTLGRPADLDEIKKIAKEKPIIEDCAHSLLSQYRGKITGTLGVASFFSLGKYISAGGGGMIILNDDKLNGKFKHEIELLYSPTMMREIKHSLFVYIFSYLYHKPWFGGFAFYIGTAFDNKMDIADKKSFEVTKIKKSDMHVFLNKLETFSEKVEKQRKNSKMLLEKLQNTDFVLPYELKDTKCNYFLFPIVFNNKEKRDTIHEQLRNSGIDTVKLYNLTPGIAKKFYGYNGNCPNAEKLAERVLIIPNYYTLSNKELLKISNSIIKSGELL